jgi:hypothetical protein
VFSGQPRASFRGEIIHASTSPHGDGESTGSRSDELTTDDSGCGTIAAIDRARCLLEAKQRCGRAIAGFAAYFCHTMTRGTNSGLCESSAQSKPICLPGMRTPSRPHGNGVRKLISPAVTTGCRGQPRIECAAEPVCKSDALDHLDSVWSRWKIDIPNRTSFTVHRARHLEPRMAGGSARTGFDVSRSFSHHRQSALHAGCE